MGWPYEFLTLDEQQKHARRLALDKYAAYAQLSVLVPVGLFLLCRLAVWAAKAATARRGSYDAIPNSPQLKRQRESAWIKLRIQVDKVKWWLGEDVYLFGQLSGQRDVWILGTAWMVWLLYLCVAETGQGELYTGLQAAGSKRRCILRITCRCNQALANRNQIISISPSDSASSQLPSSPYSISCPSSPSTRLCQCLSPPMRQ